MISTLACACKRAGTSAVARNVATSKGSFALGMMGVRAGVAVASGKRDFSSGGLAGLFGFGKKETESKGFFSGISDAMQSRADVKMKESEAKQEKAWLHSLSRVPEFNYEVFATMTKNMMNEAGANGWKSKIPGFKRFSKTEEAEKILNMVDLMTIEERRGRVKITKKEIQRIAAGSGFAYEEVEQFVESIRVLQTVHKWVHRRSLEGHPPPESYAEMNVLMLKDRRGIPAPVPRWRIQKVKASQERLDRLNRNRRRSSQPQ